MPRLNNKGELVNKQTMSDEEFFKLQGNYKKLAAVEEVEHNNLLVDIFISHWKLKFKAPPLFADTLHFAQMRGFQKIAGKKSEALIEHYFAMKDEWFISQAYSLDCLCKNINKVNASYSLFAESRNKENKVAVDVHCDSCWAPFQMLAGLNHDWDKMMRCPPCEKANRPLKKVTKAERQAAVYKLSQLFPEMPKP